MARKLSLGTKLGFGVCDLGGNLFFTAMGFWTLNYLTDTVMLGAAAAGIAIMIGKLWDAVTDPMMGYISDRTRSRWGRRRPYLLFGAIPLFLTMWLFFTNPHLEGRQALLTVWAAVALCLLNTAYTIVNIPYSSLTPEMTDDYNERSVLNGFRFCFAGVGTIIGVLALIPINSFANKSSGYSMIGGILGFIMAVTALITFFSIREPGHEKAQRPTEGFFDTYAIVFRNKPYLIILFTYALNISALAFVQTIVAYYYKYIFHDEGSTFLAMGALIIVAIAFIPVSVLVSKKIGKKRSYQICFLILSISCLVLFFLGHILGKWFFFGMMIFAGIGLGFGYSAPWAMVPDTIEYDAIKTGKRKEGAFYGMWTFVSKIGNSIALALTGGILGWAKYVPNVEQSPSSIFAIRLIVGPIPALVFLGALILVQFYPLDEKAYAALLEEKAKKEAEAKKA
jgi:glycoside/pentoside/hexuronide:cation symporter, GPH family